MKTVLLIFAMLSAVFCGCGNKESPEKPLRVITYNIYIGFKDSLGGQTAKTRDREQKFIAWMKEQQPNVAALQELNTINSARLAEIASAYGHPYSVLLETETGYNLALTAKTPITVREKTTDNFCHGLIWAEIGGINYFAVHFSPNEYPVRRREASQVSARIKNLLDEGKNCIVLGDFNNLSPSDKAAYDSMETVKSFQLTDEKYERHQNLHLGQLDFQPVNTLLDAGLSDVYKVIHPEGFTKSYCTTIKESNRVLRIDYIFPDPELTNKCRAVEIVNDEKTNAISDHYPVIADFRW